MFGGGDGDEGDDSDEEGRAAPGYGSGRRMPIQQAVDVAVPVKRAYNYWTSFEDWPEFMHRIESAEEVDDTTVSFQAKIWGISKRFEAEIVEQHPEERIEWNVTDGYSHTGVVTFHPLAKNLTRIDVSLDVQPANLIDKASRGMRFVKRAVRGDLHRFKAYVELENETKTGRRQTIEDGKVKRKKSSSSSSRAAARSAAATDPRRRTGRSRRRGRGAERWRQAKTQARDRRRAAARAEPKLEAARSARSRAPSRSRTRSRRNSKKRSGSAAGNSRNPSQENKGQVGDEGHARTRPSETRSVVEREGHGDDGRRRAGARARTTRTTRSSTRRRSRAGPTS